MTEQERKGLNQFVAKVRAYYGQRLHDVLLVGTRTRPDDPPFHDADVVVILKVANTAAIGELLRLADFGYDPLIETGLFINPWLLSVSDLTSTTDPDKVWIADLARKHANSVLESA